MFQSIKNWWQTSAIVNKIKDWCWHSVTVLWSYIKIIGGAMLLSVHEGFSYIGNMVTDPSIKSALDSMNFPAYVGLGLAVIGFITLAARLRSL